MSMEFKEKALLYQGYSQVWRWTLQDKTKVKSYEVIERGHSAALLAFDNSQQQVLLERQFRPGSYPEKEQLFELIAGMIDKGETPNDAIVREAKEEAGLKVDKAHLITLGRFYLSPGIMTESTTIFLYPCDLDKVKANFQGGLNEEGEDIELLKYSYHDCQSFLKEPNGESVTLILALQALFSLYSNR